MVPGRPVALRSVDVVSGSMEVPVAADSDGAAVDFSQAGVGGAYLQIGGSFSASYQIHGSIDGGATWVDVTALFFDASTGTFLAEISAPVLCVCAGSVRPPLSLRVHCVSHSAGAPTGAYSYRSPI